MQTSLHRFFDPSHYHLGAVASAAEASVESIASHFLMVRLAIELHSDNRSGARAILQRLEGEARAGHDLFLQKTAHLILAIQDDTEIGLRAALDDNYFLKTSLST